MSHHLLIRYSTFAYCISLILKLHLLNIFFAKAIFYSKNSWLNSLLLGAFNHCNFGCFVKVINIYFIGTHFHVLRHFLIKIIQIFCQKHSKIELQSLFMMTVFQSFFSLMNVYLVESFKKRNCSLYKDYFNYRIDFQINFQFIHLTIT